MKLFVAEEELQELDARLALLSGEERLAAMVELAWHLRQRDCGRALGLADASEALLAQPGGADHQRALLTARLLLVRGSIHLLFVRLDLAASSARGALGMFTGLADHAGMADAHGLLAMLANDCGDTGARTREWAASAEHARQCGDAIRLDAAESEIARGQAFADVGAARLRWDARFPDDLSFADPAATASVGDYLGLVANLSSQFGKVVTFRVRVYDASLATGQVRRAIVCALNIAHAFINLSNPLLALEWVRRALDLARPAGWPLCLAMCHTQMAETLRQLGRLDEAKVLLEEALELLTPLAGSRSYALALEHLAEVLLEQQHFQAAIDTFGLLEARAAALGQSNFLSVVRRGQAQALAKLGRTREALAAAGEALTVAHAQNDRIRQVNALRTLADIYSRDALGELPLPAGVAANGAPLHHLRLACKVATTIDGYSVSAALLEALGKEHARVNNYPLAYHAMVEAAEARRKVHSEEAANLAAAMQVQHSTETLREEAERERRAAVDEAHRAAAEIERLAWSDALTGLANRARLLDRLAAHTGRSRHEGSGFSVLFLDLDHFKKINDLHGPACGDRLLRSAADRMAKGIADGALLARLGGDEFAVLLPDASDADAARRAAREILQLLGSPAPEEEHRLHLTASIGIATFPGDGGDGGALLKNAETAMRSAKETGRNGIAVYTPAMGEAVLIAIDIEQRLRNAVAQDEFHLCYQPKIDALSGRIVGMEALLRWRSPPPGFDSPERFVPIAERLGVIATISDWVLRAASAQNRAWQDEGLPALPVAVNLSAQEFEDPLLAGRVVRALEETGLAPRWLEIELTEGALVKDADAARVNLETLAALGVGIAIDDFGTGYSSLAYLASFPIGRLKIDQSFVRALAPGNRSVEITRTIIGIGKRLDMKVIAEGVETEEQAAFLRREQCDELQGYLFGRPVAADAFGALLRRESRNAAPERK